MAAFEFSSLQFRKAFPRQYLEHFLQQDIRPDGRELLQWRPTSLHRNVITNSDGSATVSRGGTVVTCGVKLEVGVPAAIAPNQGRLAVNVHMTPLAFPDLEIGKPTQESIAYGELLSKIMISSGALDLTQLCIREGECCWVLQVDIVFLSYDGNLLDPSLLALCSALETVKVPAVDVEETGEVVILENGHLTPLRVRHKPIGFTFGLTDAYVILDPTAEEEQILQSRVSIIFSPILQTCSVFKLGGSVGLSKQRLNELLEFAKVEATKVLFKNVHDNVVA
eukprot:TRINITY_DN1886_c0_g1_i1.p1 TRINITY_DN1886_c0_g1~~TRINITY_DN1886_c0_g1_i1.p1  ORF type:complete len:300 (+),score=44.06 TRINITY_DN1886_c0_g1_i1:61-900(+)